MDKQKILIADDQHGIRDIIKIIFEKEYDVIEAKDGSDVIEIINSGDIINYSLIILDIIMPKVDGFEVLELLKQKNITDIIPVIIISVNDEINNIDKAYKLGACSYITKPFHPSNLYYCSKNTINTFARLREAERGN